MVQNNYQILKLIIIQYKMAILKYNNNIELYNNNNSIYIGSKKIVKSWQPSYPGSLSRPEWDIKSLMSPFRGGTGYKNYRLTSPIIKCW